jgi:hypothetical protein
VTQAIHDFESDKEKAIREPLIMRKLWISSACTHLIKPGGAKGKFMAGDEDVNKRWASCVFNLAIRPEDSQQQRKPPK